MVEDRHGQQVVDGDEPRHLLAVGVRFDGDGLAVGADVEDGLRGIGRDELAQRHDPPQFAGAGIEHMDRVDRLASALDLLQVLQRLRRRIGRGHADELGGHDAAGRADPVGQEQLQRRRGLEVEPHQHQGAVGAVELAQGVCRAIGRHARQNLTAERFRQRHEEFAGAVEFRAVEHLDRAAHRQVRQHAGGIFGAHLVQTCDDVGDVFVDDLREEHRVHGRGRKVMVWHGSPLDPRSRRIGASRPSRIRPRGTATARTIDSDCRWAWVGVPVEVHAAAGAANRAGR